MKFKYKLTKKHIFEITFSLIVAVLFIVRLCTGVDEPSQTTAPVPADSVKVADPALTAAQEAPQPADKTNVSRPGLEDSLRMAASRSDSVLTIPGADPAHLYGPNTHMICRVSSYETAFPDANDVQLSTAAYLGITPQATRDGVVALCGNGLVDISHSPYYHVDDLTNSSPHLTPRAQLLLNRIGRNFIDSLLVKHIEPALLMVTSVTRSQEDIGRLQAFNFTAVETSCHQSGTTFDISYIKYKAFPTMDGGERRLVRDDTLKWVLSEVLDDLRQGGACHVKHERKQGCFHITVR